MKIFAAFPGLASVALAVPTAPAHAAGDITNFNVRNCTSERIFVCSFDKTDSLMKIPYKARGIQPEERKEFGCASLGKCKVIVGVPQRTSKRTLSTGMLAALSTGAVSSAAIAGMTGAAVATTTATGAGYVLITPVTSAATTMAGVGTVTAMTVAAGVAAAIAVAAGGSIAGIEIADGWDDGEVCNQVRKAAQNAGMKPKSFMKNGNVYQVIEQYATDKDGNAFVNPDGTAVFSYVAEQGRGKCPNPLAKQLVRD